MLQTIIFKPGDIIKVHQRIREGDKTRVQVFKGVVLAIKGRGANRMFTVQKMVGSISVERIWAVESPLIEKVEIDAKPKRRIRRAKLNYLKVKKKKLH
jgi:large subunit ribosomal protein L19